MFAQVGVVVTSDHQPWLNFNYGVLLRWGHTQTILDGKVEKVTNGVTLDASDICPSISQQPLLNPTIIL